MLKKAIYVAISILLILPCLTESYSFTVWGRNLPLSFQKPCDMDHCDMDHASPNTPKCPLCPTFNSFAPYLCNGVRIDPPTFPSSFALVSVDALSDQGVIKAIFRPPTSIIL
jgi:hypothetical protein